MTGMFKHLLVPLDGSRLAEAALPAAVSLARSFDARVTLFHVIERDAPKAVHGERHLDDPEEADAYLREVASRTFPAGARVEFHVHDAPESSVSRSIARHAEEFGIELIVMCTHGRGGLKAFMYGRIAQQAAALSTIPVLFVQPGEPGETRDFQCRRLLVPLDGNPGHEQGLAAARQFAGVYRAELGLVMVVHKVDTLPAEDAAAARMLPLVTVALLDIAQQDAQKYLCGHVKCLREEGLSASAQVLRGDPVSSIAEAAETMGADLVVMGTHAKTGLNAFWSRSATPQLSRRLHVPILLVPVMEITRS
ncbi:MAG: universal stress protein [Deltaproteobacteria bacterium]|nr:universal stress protein [Deltaproteobacteria bacterium]